MPKRVITVHGINTRGEWQEQVKEVLDGHFVVESLKYSTYRRFGKIRILVEPWVLLFGWLVLFVLQAWLQFGNLVTLLLSASIFCLALAASFQRRELTLRQLKKSLDALNATGKPPHVIAHSFGTYFVGRIIEKWSDVRYDHLILTGCVLKCSTPWTEYLKMNPRAVRKVRNDMALKDKVAMLALFVYGLFPGLGHAGVYGFKDASHDVEPYDVCGRGCTKLVHNVKLQNLGHSDVFVGSGHAEHFWLPFLWELDSQDFEDFLEVCVLADEAEKLGDEYRLGILEDDLRRRRWRWANNVSLDAYLKQQIACLLKRKGTRPARERVRRMLPMVTRELWRVVARAVEAQRLGSEAGDPAWKNFLHPQMAVTYAVSNTEA